MLSPSDIRPAVEAVLIAADRSLTTYEILNRLPDNLLQQIISERGMPGLGSGKSYSAASLVSDSVEGLLPSLEPPYRVYENRQAVFTVAGQEIHPSNSAIAFYRLNPPVKIPPVTIQLLSNYETKPVTMIKIPWYDRPWIMAAWLIFFWPVWVYGFYKTNKLKGYQKLLLAFPAAIFLMAVNWNTKNSSSDYAYSDTSSPELPSQNQEIDTPTNPSADAVWQERLTAEKAYVTKMMEFMGTWGAAYQKIGGMLSQYGSSPELLQDESWRAGFVVAMVTAQLASKQIQSIQNVPDNAKQHHHLLIKAAQEGDMGLALLVRGIDKQGADLITQGLPHFRRGVDLSNEANSELENMKQRTLKEAQNH